MKKTNLIRFAQSLVLLPAMAMSIGANSPAASQNVLVQKINMTSGVLTLNQVLDPAAAKQRQLEQAQAEAIDAYFERHDMPLEGTGMKMVQAAEANDLDWRLLPAIAVRESTGGKNDCDRVRNNPFGWGSCKIGFYSIDQAIDTIAANLGGNNPNTARHYDNKTTKQILHAYNPPSIVPRYAEQVMSIMNDIGSPDMASVTTPNANS